MPKFHLPKCVTEFPDGSVCNRDMKPLGERHPSFGPNYRPGFWVFRCEYCAAVRAIEDTKTGRYCTSR